MIYLKLIIIELLHIYGRYLIDTETTFKLISDTS